MHPVIIDYDSVGSCQVPGSMSHPKMGLSGKLTLVHVIIFTSVLSILFLLDILTTQAILRMGGVELNPLMAGVVTTPLMHVTLKCGGTHNDYSRGPDRGGPGERIGDCVVCNPDRHVCSSYYQ